MITQEEVQVLEVLGRLYISLQHTLLASENKLTEERAKVSIEVLKKINKITKRIK